MPDLESSYTSKKTITVSSPTTSISYTPTVNSTDRYWYRVKATWTGNLTSVLSDGVCISASGLTELRLPGMPASPSDVLGVDTMNMAQASEAPAEGNTPDAPETGNAGYGEFEASVHRTIGLGGGNNPPVKLYFYHVDHLGTPRVITDVSGNLVSKHKYLPFGEELSPPATTNSHKFTGHERDAETGLDYMLARYFSGSQARFTSPDALTGNLYSPESLNRYIYGSNNPIRNIDPTGNDVVDYNLLTSGQNQVPNTPHADIPDVTELGQKEAPNGDFLAMNIQAIFDEGDNPADYEPKREAYIIREEGYTEGEPRAGKSENPSKSQTATSGNSQYTFDAPGVKAEGAPRSSLNGKLDVAFSYSEKNKKTGQTSDKQLFYRVTLLIQNGKIVGCRAVKLTEDEFNKLTGKKPKPKTGTQKGKNKE